MASHMSVFGGNRKSSKRSHLSRSRVIWVSLRSPGGTRCPQRVGHEALPPDLSCSGYGDRFCHRLPISRSTFATPMLLPLPFMQAAIEGELWLSCFRFHLPNLA